MSAEESKFLARLGRKRLPVITVGAEAAGQLRGSVHPDEANRNEKQSSIHKPTLPSVQGTGGGKN